MDNFLKLMPEINKLLDFEILFWERMQNTERFPTIIGLVPEYKILNDMVKNIGSPAINRAIYEHERSIMIELLKQYIVGNQVII